MDLKLHTQLGKNVRMSQNITLLPFLTCQQSATPYFFLIHPVPTICAIMTSFGPIFRYKVKMLSRRRKNMKRSNARMIRAASKVDSKNLIMMPVAKSIRLSRSTWFHGSKNQSLKRTRQLCESP